MKYTCVLLTTILLGSCGQGYPTLEDIPGTYSHYRDEARLIIDSNLTFSRSENGTFGPVGRWEWHRPEREIPGHLPAGKGSQVFFFGWTVGKDTSRKLTEKAVAIYRNDSLILEMYGGVEYSKKN